ncbi:radical SAM protein [Candidatus Binatia bacterium]|nr:radical SAM protein [Candidatus Binatia bacterium]
MPTMPSDGSNPPVIPTAPWQPESIWVGRDVAGTAVARRIVARLPGVPVQVVDEAGDADSGLRFVDGKRRLVIKRQNGSFLHHCPAGTPGLVCCNYLILNLAVNCPFDCGYCFLQDYAANNPALKVFANPEDGLAEVDAVLRAHPDRTFRIGTAELADSLALDHLTDLSQTLVPFFAGRPNAILELKTKSDRIENLLHLDPRDRVVVSWSLNSGAIMRGDEAGTATFEQRLAAARLVQNAGYKVGLHFDPLVAHEGWEEGYRVTVQSLATLDLGRIAWVSLGSLRMTPSLKAAVRARPTNGQVLSRHLLTGELVPGPDGKERAWRGLRTTMYRRTLAWLRELDARLPIYICMEPAGVWERVMGFAPTDREVALHLVAEG